MKSRYKIMLLDFLLVLLLILIYSGQFYLTNVQFGFLDGTLDIANEFKADFLTAESGSHFSQEQIQKAAYLQESARRFSFWLIIHLVLAIVVFVITTGFIKTKMWAIMLKKRFDLRVAMISSLLRLASISLFVILLVFMAKYFKWVFLLLFLGLFSLLLVHFNLLCYYYSLKIKKGKEVINRIFMFFFKDLRKNIKYYLISVVLFILCANVIVIIGQVIGVALIPLSVIVPLSIIPVFIRERLIHAE